jgi:hypothetical protein
MVLAALVNAKRVTVYRLADGKPQPVMVRLGASDGSSTEISRRRPQGRRPAGDRREGGQMSAAGTQAAAVIRTAGLGKVYSPGSEAE